MNDVPAGNLAPAARLLGRLLVRELDVATVDELAQPAVAAALAELGIAVPPPADLDALAAAYFAHFVRPAAGLPPVQSLWLHGQYDGDAAQAVRAIAEAGSLELAPGARGAPPDHLGCILLLWADIVEDRPDLAARLQRDHFAWGERALSAVGRGAGFYSSVARAAAMLLRELAV